MAFLVCFLIEPSTICPVEELRQRAGPSHIKHPKRNHFQTYLQANLEEAFSHLGLLLSTWLSLVSSWLKRSQHRKRTLNEARGRGDLNTSTHHILIPDYRHCEMSCHHAFPRHDWLQTLKPWTFLCLSCFSDILFQQREKQCIASHSV